MNSSIGLKWLPCIPLPNNQQQCTTDDISTVENEFSFNLPQEYINLVLAGHQGQQPASIQLSAQNLSTNKWIHTKMGPFYHFCSDNTDELQSSNITAVNQNWRESMTDNNNSTNNTTESSSSSAAASASSSNNTGTRRSVRRSRHPNIPFFSFSEDHLGRLFSIDTSSGVILLIDPTHRTGPFVVAENFTDLLERMEEAATTTASNTDSSSAADREYEDSAGEVPIDTEDYDPSDFDGIEYNSDDNEYACNICISLLSGSIRYHCIDPACADVDLCSNCYTNKKEKDTHKANHEIQEIKE